MKKLVFAIQVFGIIALFPVVMILELNRSNVRSYENNSRLMIEQHMEINSISLPVKLEKDIFPATVETILLQAFK